MESGEYFAEFPKFIGLPLANLRLRIKEFLGDLNNLTFFNCNNGQVVPVRNSISQTRVIQY